MLKAGLETFALLLPDSFLGKGAARQVGILDSARVSLSSGDDANSLGKSIVLVLYVPLPPFPSGDSHQLSLRICLPLAGEGSTPHHYDLTLAPCHPC